MKIRLLLSILAFSLIAAACGGASEVAGDLAEDVADVVEEAVDETVEENSDILNGDDEEEEEVDEEEVAETTTTEAPEEEAAEGAVATEIDGQALYEANCTRCHGAEGQGGRGPSLQGIAAEQPDQTAGIDQTINGGGGMPAFGERLTGEEIQATIDYIWDTF